MNVSIKKRIYWSFFILVFLFVVNGIASIITLSNNRKLSENVSSVTDPSLQSLEDFDDLLVASKMYTTNWVFLRSSQEDKDALIKLHNTDYPKLKQRLNFLSAKWNDTPSEDSLKKIYAEFEQLLMFENKIMSSLQKFEDYDDPAIKMEAERIVEDELLPRTTAIINSLGKIQATVQSIRAENNIDLEKSFMYLRLLITVLAITIISIGIFLSLYMTRIIINPINKIRNIINDLGKGIIKKVDNKVNNDEIGEMVNSVNNLSEKLHATAAFAAEIGNRNFNTNFEPLSTNDTLGKALVTMRDSLKTSDQKLNEAQHIAHLGNWERDVATGKVFFSDEMLNIFDIDSASFDLNFQSVVKFIHPEDIDHLKNINKKYLQDHQPVAYECRIVTAKGLTKTIFVHSKVVLNTHGEVTGTVGIVQDITERKQNEERLAGERELFRLVIENIPDQIYLKDTESRFMLCNMPVATNAGRASQAEMIGKTDFDFLPAEIAKQCFAEEQHIIQSGIPLINHEEHMHDKITGKSRWSLSTKFPLRNNSGDMIGLIGINHDITKRKIAERELEEANRELTILFNSIDEIFFSVDMVTFKVIQISDTCEKLYGYTQAEFFSNYELWFQIIHPEDKYIIENENEMMRRGELISNQYRIIRKDNNIRWVETKITPTLNKEGKLIRVDGLTRDITDRKNAEAELNNSEERYRKIVETSQEGIWMVDENNKTVFVNKKMCEMFEYSQEHMMGKEIFYFMEDDWKQKGSDAMSLIVAGKGGKMEFRFITKSGLYLWTNLSVNAVFNDAGIYKGALAMVTDITKRKNDEELLQKSQLTLEKKNLELEQKNKELEQFAYVASHDLQEPLRTITSFVQIFKQQYSGKLDSKSDKYLKYIVQASDRMRVLIKDLLDFSRIGHNKDIEQVDSAQILHDVMADINKIIQDSHADISAEHLPVINGYTTELKQLFKNLVLNAIKFRKQNVPLKINITARRKNDHWQFAVTDNGIGIDEQHYDRIFVIFQRLHTRSEYQGSGIGLSHCKKIVELHHGKIWVQSTPGEGSTFYFTIHSPKQKINEAEIKMHNAN